VRAHEVVDPRSGFPSGSSGSVLHANDPKFPTEDGSLLDRIDAEQHVEVWAERVEERYGYQHDSNEAEHDDDGGDRYDDEYERDDFLDQA